jgi:hypothetical protein
MPSRRRVELSQRNVGESWDRAGRGHAQNRPLIDPECPNDLVVDDADAAARDGFHRQFLVAG